MPGGCFGAMRTAGLGPKRLYRILRSRRSFGAGSVRRYKTRPCQTQRPGVIHTDYHLIHNSKSLVPHREAIGTGGANLVEARVAEALDASAPLAFAIGHPLRERQFPRLRVGFGPADTVGSWVGIFRKELGDLR